MYKNSDLSLSSTITLPSSNIKALGIDSVYVYCISGNKIYKYRISDSVKMWDVDLSSYSDGNRLCRIEKYDGYLYVVTNKGYLLKISA